MPCNPTDNTNISGEITISVFRIRCSEDRGSSYSNRWHRSTSSTMRHAHNKVTLTVTGVSISHLEQFDTFNIAASMTEVIIIIIFNLRTAAFKVYCAIWVRRSNFRHQASPSLSPCESTQRRKVKLWARNVR